MFLKVASLFLLLLKQIQSCSNQCFCEPFNLPTSVSCQDLDTIPQDLPPMLKKLNLASNFLLQIEPGVINQYTKLEYLILTQNRISGLKSKNFYRLGQLIDLELAQNSINFVPDQTFAGLAKLKKLDLSFNQIEILNSNVFVSCQDLQHLDLSHNKLTKLHSDTLNGLQSLQVKNLKLDRNSTKIRPKFDRNKTEIMVEIGQNRTDIGSKLEF